MSSRQLNAGYLERKLRAVTGVQGSRPLGEQSDLEGLLTLEVDRPEWGFAGGELRFGINQPDLGGVGLRYIALINPPASGIIAIVQWAERTLVAGLEIWGTLPIVGLSLAGSLGSGSGNTRDTRHANTSACRVDVGSNAASITGNLIHTAGVINGLAPFGDPIAILKPGTAFTIEAGVAATPIRYSLFWRERPLEGAVEIK